jgi:hypothetical protein
MDEALLQQRGVRHLDSRLALTLTSCSRLLTP